MSGNRVVHAEGLMQQAFVYLAAAVVAVPLAKRLGLGAVLGYLIAGVVIGPFGLGLLASRGSDIMHFAEFGVVMLLFLIGLELEPTRLWRMRGTLFGLGGLQVVATSLVLAGIALALGMSWRPGLAVGLILSLSSTAIVLQSLSERALLHCPAGERSFAVLLFQDLAVIPMLAALPLLGSVLPESSPAHAGGWLDDLPGWGRTLVTIGAVVAIVAAGRWVVRPIFRTIAQTRVQEVFTAAALLIVVGIALLMAQVGLSAALGAFVGGVVLANSEYRHELEGDIEPFKGLLLGLFFIAVGASIDFGLVGERAGGLTALIVGLVVVKFAVLFAISFTVRMSIDQRLLFALALSQGGEFCFVLLSFAAQNGILDPASANLLVAAVALSMAATPLLLLFHERVVQPRFAGSKVSSREADTIDEQGAVIVAGFGAFGSIVGRFLFANSVPTTVLDFDPDHVDLLRRLGMRVFYGDATRHELLRAAGAEHAKVMVVAVGDRTQTLAIVAEVRQHFPQLKLFARAHTREEAYALLDAGVEHIYRESLDTALHMGADTLRALGLRAYQAQRAARSFRRHDERVLRELAPVRDDEKFVPLARQVLHDLERMLQDEQRDAEAPDDAAWDVESLRREYGGAEGPGGRDE